MLQLNISTYPKKEQKKGENYDETEESNESDLSFNSFM